MLVATRLTPAGRAAVLLVLVLLGWGVGELTQLRQGPDLHFVQEVAEQREPVSTALARGLSWAGSSAVIALLAVVSSVGLWLAHRHRAAALVAFATAGAAVIVNLDKLLVGRPRPPVEQLVTAGHSSFPSGHVTLSAAFYLSLLIVLLSRRPSRAITIAAATATVLLVGGIALSRVYLGVHYPTDVTGGILLGASWAVLLAIPLASRRRPR